MCTRPYTFTFPASVHERLQGIYSPRKLQIPCGKCAECLKKRQNDLTTRVYREAQAKGKASFVTLTYRPEHIPICQSLWQVDLNTGEFKLSDLAKPELIADPYRNDNIDMQHVLRAASLRGEIGQTKKGVPMIYERFLAPGLLAGGRWYIRYTPTLYYNDVQNAFKRFRKKHPDYNFTYVCVGEYSPNPNFTHRPHYHLVLFGLTYKQSLEFAGEWKFGFTTVKQVSFISRSKDGRPIDGLARVARYCGKYCSKGILDAYSRRDGCTLGNRLRSSKGLGAEYQSLKDYIQAQDIYRYDPDNPQFGSEEIRQKVIDTIINRSFININGFHYALPQSLRRKIFGWRKVNRDNITCLPEMFQGRDLPPKERARYLESFKDSSVWSPIYYMVADELRNRSMVERNRQFAQFAGNVSPENFSDAITAFEDYTETLAEIREKSQFNSLLNFYKHSKL